MNDFKNGFEKLEQKHFDFLKMELGLTKDEISLLDDEEMNDKVYEPICDIEISETPLDNTELSNRCLLASEIVTILGNSLAQVNGWLDED